MDLYYAGPAQPLTTAGEELDDLDHDLSEVVQCFIKIDVLRAATGYRGHSSSIFWPTIVSTIVLYFCLRGQVPQLRNWAISTIVSFGFTLSTSAFLGYCIGHRVVAHSYSSA